MSCAVAYVGEIALSDFHDHRELLVEIVHDDFVFDVDVKLLDLVCVLEIDIQQH